MMIVNSHGDQDDHDDDHEQCSHQDKELLANDLKFQALLGDLLEVLHLKVEINDHLSVLHLHIIDENETEHWQQGNDAVGQDQD